MNMATNLDVKILKKKMNIYLEKELTFGKKKGTSTQAILRLENFKDKDTIAGLQKKIIKSTWELIKMEKEAQIKETQLCLNGEKIKIKVVKDLQLIMENFNLEISGEREILHFKMV